MKADTVYQELATLREQNAKEHGEMRTEMHKLFASQARWIVGTVFAAVGVIVFFIERA